MNQNGEHGWKPTRDSLGLEMIEMMLKRWEGKYGLNKFEMVGDINFGRVWIKAEVGTVCLSNQGRHRMERGSSL